MGSLAKAVSQIYIRLLITSVLLLVIGGYLSFSIAMNHRKTNHKPLFILLTHQSPTMNPKSNQHGPPLTNTPSCTLHAELLVASWRRGTWYLWWLRISLCLVSQDDWETYDGQWWLLMVDGGMWWLMIDLILIHGAWWWLMVVHGDCQPVT